MRDALRSRSRAVSTFVVIVVGLGALFAACTTYQRDDGGACIKDSDCNSGYCVQQLCASAPPFLPGNSYPGADAAGDTSVPASDAGGEGGTPPSDAASDGDAPAAPVDSGHDSGHDAGVDSSDSAVDDSGGDAADSSG